MTKRFQTAGTITFMKTLLMVFNLAFWGTGLTMLLAGIWMQMELHKYIELSADSCNIAPYLVALGAFILLLGTLACCCTVKGQPSLLYIYGGFLALIFVMEVALAASMYMQKDRISADFERGLNQSMIQYGPTSIVKSADFDTMQANLHCCGNHGSADWLNLTPPRPVPRSCCRESNCDTQDDLQIYTDGCYTVGSALLETNMGMIAASALTSALFPLVGTMLSCCLATNIAKTKYEQMP